VTRHGHAVPLLRSYEQPTTTGAPSASRVVVVAAAVPAAALNDGVGPAA
jgi:hypothetical protein